MKDNFVVTIAGGGSTYTPGIVMMLLENMARFPLREIRLYDNHQERQKTIGDACAILVAERFPRVDVRHVYFEDRRLEDGERVANPVTVVRPGTGVDQHGVDGVAMRLMDAFAHCTLEIRLEALDFDAEFLTERLQPCVDLAERDRPVLRRVALAEHVEVDAV